MIRRTMYVTASMECCRDGAVVYSPQPRKFEIIEEMEEFPTSLVRWRDIKGEIVEEQIRSLAEDECMGMGTPRLCNFRFHIDRVEEEKIEIEIPKIPRDVQLRIERIEEMIKEAETIDEKMALEDELRKLKDRYGIK